MLQYDVHDRPLSPLSRLIGNYLAIWGGTINPKEDSDDKQAHFESEAQEAPHTTKIHHSHSYILFI